MKKKGILNRDISEVIASMGHTDKLVICDGGFPIPSDMRRIDLALIAGKPPFLETLEIILDELAVEKIIIAEETEQVSPMLYKKIRELFPGDIEVEKVPHIEFKQIAKEAKAVIRTGEFTPYANIILVSGVVYK